MTDVKARIEKLLKYKRLSFWISILGAAAVLAISSSLVLSDATEKTNSFENAESNIKDETPVIIDGNNYEVDNNVALSEKLSISDQWHNIFIGMIDDEEFIFDIYRNSYELTAFLVKRSDQDNEVKFIGEIIGDKVVFQAYDDGGEISSIEGYGSAPDKDDIECVFSLSKSSINKPVVIKLIYAFSSDSAEHPYKYYDTKAVNELIAEIKSDIATANKESLSKKILYPINVNSGGTSKAISTPQEFIQEYDNIINDRFKKDIANAYTKFLFNNYQGIMFNEGFFNIWIGGNAFEQPMIIAINH